MTKAILYAANAIDLATGETMQAVKVGVTASEAYTRIVQLNSTKMPIKVELAGAWSFELTSLDAMHVERAAHDLLAPLQINGEWFKDEDGSLVDRVGRFCLRLGAIPAGRQTAELSELSDKQHEALERMRTVFEPLAPRLATAGIEWEYMTWKVGLSCRFGRMNIEVRKSGALYLKLPNAAAPTLDALEGDRTDNGAVHSSPRPPPSPCGAPYGVQPRRTPDSPYRVVPEPTSRSEGSHRPIDIWR